MVLQDETRCGLTYNVCKCDLDNYNAGKCNLNTMDLECDRPEGYKLSNRGLCIIDTGGYCCWVKVQVVVGIH